MAPFLLTIALFLLGFLGLAISLFPYIVPPRFTIWQAANAVSALQFALVGYAVVMPLTLAYTGYAYWVFRGKWRRTSNPGATGIERGLVRAKGPPAALVRRLLRGEPRDLHGTGLSPARRGEGLIGFRGPDRVRAMQGPRGRTSHPPSSPELGLRRVDQAALEAQGRLPVPGQQERAVEVDVLGVVGEQHGGRHGEGGADHAADHQG